MNLPDSGDPWVWAEWMLYVERDLYVRMEWEDPRTRGKYMVLMPMAGMSPEQWVFYTKRLFFDRTYPVMSVEDWRAREASLGLEPAPIAWPWAPDEIPETIQPPPGKKARKPKNGPVKSVEG